MKRFLILIFSIFYTLQYAQLENINTGESLTYRIHYGPLNAGYATLTTSAVNYNGQPHMYVHGEGKTTGAVKAFFKVEDNYESYINRNTGLPSFYVRNVKEGSYRQHFEVNFNHQDNTVILTDKKNSSNGSKKLKSVKNIQDMLSSFYYLRSKDASELKVGTIIKMNIWIDDEMFPFQLRVAGTETLKTKFGRIECLKIIPSVMSGRVFKEKEGVTLWVSKDNNHVPILIKAELAVGSLKASLNDYKNVKYKLNFTK